MGRSRFRFVYTGGERDIFFSLDAANSLAWPRGEGVEGKLECLWSLLPCCLVAVFREGRRIALTKVLQCSMHVSGTPSLLLAEDEKEDEAVLMMKRRSSWDGPKERKRQS